MEQDAVWLLMARHLSGESSQQEDEQLFALLSGNHQWQMQFEIMKSTWGRANEQVEQLPVDEEEMDAIKRILQASKQTEAAIVPLKKSPRRFWAWAAAASILLAVCAFWFYNADDKTQLIAQGNSVNDSVTNIVCRKGTRSKNILPDGSTVWLNAGSSLSYKKQFSNSNLREVELVGEAFFDVVKNPEKPFIVHAPGMLVKVLGTSFNVRSYPNDKTTETTLIHGKVEVTNTSSKVSKTYVLAPNQKLVMVKEAFAMSSEQVEDEDQQVIFRESGISTVTAVNKDELLPETAWTENRLVFKGDTFEELARKLERWYNVSIVFQDEQVKHLSFSGSLENETKEQAFEALQAVASFNYSIKANEILVKSHP